MHAKICTKQMLEQCHLASKGIMQLKRQVNHNSDGRQGKNCGVREKEPGCNAAMNI